MLIVLQIDTIKINIGVDGGGGGGGGGGDGGDGDDTVNNMKKRMERNVIDLID